jgi:hypothetical protein
MLTRILNSNWVAYPALIISSVCVGLLYLRGKPLAEAACGMLLLISGILIAMGQRASKKAKIESE